MDIKISGFGLAINKPVAIVFKALMEAGYKVNLEEFDGQYQNTSKEDWIEYNLNKIKDTSQININVDPLPWPG